MNTDILNDIKTEIQFIKREMVNRVALVLVGLALGAPSLQAQGSGRQMTVPVSKEPLLDMGSYGNPLHVDTTMQPNCTGVRVFMAGERNRGAGRADGRIFLPKKISSPGNRKGSPALTSQAPERCIDSSDKIM